MSPRRQRHPAAHSAASPHINSLPDDVLAHVLALAGADAANKAAALAVCAHWQRVAGASPEFWAAGGSIVLNGQKLEQSVLAGGAAAKKVRGSALLARPAAVRPAWHGTQQARPGVRQPPVSPHGAEQAFLGFLRRQRGVLRHLRLLTGTSAFGGYMPAVLGSLQGGGLAELSLELGAIRNYEPLPHRTTQRILKVCACASGQAEGGREGSACVPLYCAWPGSTLARELLRPSSSAHSATSCLILSWQEVLALTSLRQLSIAVAHQSIHQDFTWAQARRCCCCCRGALGMGGC